ncbi:alpha-2-macroglobulin family protein [Paracoccus sp. p1-h21]|uniref:alpha-2-macroglobulin family protein n=1 Tax=Paracoccus sp. p1-h21 TaxID=3366951 RepID=UPI0037B7CBAB
MRLVKAIWHRLARPGLVLAVAVALNGGAAAAETALVPDRRISVMPDTDLPGGDLTPAFNTSFDACQQLCANDPDCIALTYNQRARACFPKSVMNAPQVFVGAVSAQVMDNAVTRAQAEKRAAAADWLDRPDLDAALAQARSLPGLYPPLDSDDPVRDARRAAGQGDGDTALRYYATAVGQTDSASAWLAMAEQLIYGVGADNSDAARAAASMALNAYLRAGDDATAAQALNALSMAWERLDRGRDGLRALRLAADLSDSPQIAEALEKSRERNGFRVTDNDVQSDSLTPEICASFSEALNPGLDYAPYLRLPQTGLTVEARDQQLCVGGFGHGQQVAITLRAGLPSGSGEVLARDVPINSYIRDRAPSVRFPGRAYVLPAGGDQGLAMATVNLDSVDLRLMRISDRNLIRAMRDDLFARPLDHWSARDFNDSMATQVWSGRASVPGAGPKAMNRDLTTRLAIPAEAGPLAPGIYVLEATVPGRSSEETGIAAQWFVISDFGVSTLWGADGLVTVVRGLGDAGPKPGAEVTLISRANAVLARAMTDAQGVARFDAGAVRGEGEAAPALVMVTDWQGEGADRAPADMAFLSLTDPEFDLSDRGVEGLPPAPPVDVFLTLDRGAYRAGEVINVTATARDSAARAIEGMPMTALLFRPDGIEAARQVVQPSGAGGYVLSFLVANTAPRGTWRVEMRAAADGPALATARALVEDFMPERIDFTPDLPEGPLRAGGDVALSLEARWLFGAPAAGLPVEVGLRHAPARTVPGFAGVQFGRHDAEATPEYDSLPGGQTDAQGRFATDLHLPQAQPPAIRSTDVIVSVREGAGRPVERVATRLVMPGQPALGVKPMFTDGVVSEGTEARFELAAAAPDLSAVQLPVQWVLNRIDTDYQWYALDGRWNWEPVVRRRKIAGGEAVTGQSEIAVPVEWGEYELVVTQAEGQAAPASVLFQAGWGAAALGGTETPDRLTVSLDRPDYRSGDTARVHVTARAAGQAVVSVLSNRVVSLDVVALNTGQNTISLPVTDDWGAGAYVTVSALRPLAGEQAPEAGRSREPARALGLAYAAVDPADRALQASVETPDKVSPRGTLPVRLAVQGVAAGETAFATVAVVDQGILNLTGFESPDPQNHYFGQRRLGVGLRDLYGRLILPTGAPDGALRQGGDAGASLNSKAPPPTEKLMSWFSGPVQLAADGSATLDVPVPDFNGEVRVMAVVWTRSAIGQAEATAVIRDPVVMTVTAPRFLSPGDSAQVTLALTHVSGPAGQVGLSVSDAGDAKLSPGAVPDHVTLAEKGRTSLRVPVTAGAGGLGQLRFGLTTPDGRAVSKDITIPVSLAEPDMLRQTRITLAGGQSAPIDPALTEGLMPGARMVLTTGPFAALDVAGALGRLSRYPYGCTEQVASVAMPLIYMPDLSAQAGAGSDAAAGDDSAGESRKAVQDAIGTVLTRQASGGSFGMWSPDSGDLWLDAYATDFLSRARAAGFAVPDQPFRSAIANLQNRVNYAPDPGAADGDDNAALAYAVSVLARERAATVGDLRYYADAAAAGFVTPLSAAQVGQALAAYGDQARADRMFARANALLVRQGAAVSEDQRLRGDYGSNLRDRAGVLAIAAEAGSAAIDQTATSRTLAGQIDARIQRGWGLSTQESVWTVLAAHALGQGKPDVAVDGVPLDRVVTALPPFAGQVSNTGRAETDMTIGVFGKPQSPPRAGGNGYAIHRSFYALDGAPLDPAQVPLGTRMAVVVEVTPFARSDEAGGRLIVSDPLPAGFEIDNPDLIRAGDVAALDWLDDLAEPEAAQFLHDRFNAAVTWRGAQPFRLAYLVRAVTEGTFRHPAASVEDMYRPEYRAWSDGGMVQVTP